MAASSSKPDAVIDYEDYEGVGFGVTPLSACPHLEQVQSIPKAIDVHAKCVKCEHDKENWICLTCYEVSCGRYVKGHAIDHFKSTKHSMALSFSDLSAWCYICDNYVHNDKLTEAKQSAHDSKFGAKQ